MFIDSVNLIVSSGKGGAGCTAFHREKFIIKGGPDGGDGGKGGDVIIKTDSNTDTLSSYKGKKELKAQNGQGGMGRMKYGRKGENLVLIVPPGTQVIDTDTGEILVDLLEDKMEVSLLEGGKGGLGNYHFRNSRNQKPTYSQPGLPGVSKNIRLELKLIADVGLVGYPNVGKSTLISTISNAHPEVANYEFTTITPKLGVVVVDDYSSFVMADIPGIIDGASEGKGLGLEFLKHIERTKTLLFMIDIANHRDTVMQFDVLKSELAKFSAELNTRKYAIALTKIDTFSVEEANEKILEFMKHFGMKPKKIQKYRLSDDYHYSINEEPKYDEPLFIVPISSATHINTDNLKYLLYDFVKENIQ